MDIEGLELLRDVVRTRSLSRGAVSNGVSQSAASQRPHEIEKGLGVMLLDRGTRPAATAPAGRVYLDFRFDVLRRKERPDAELDELRTRIEGSVRVASIYSMSMRRSSTERRISGSSVTRNPSGIWPRFRGGTNPWQSPWRWVLA